jgi:hypothetical protein
MQDKYKGTLVPIESHSHISIVEELNIDGHIKPDHETEARLQTIRSSQKGDTFVIDEDAF